MIIRTQKIIPKIFLYCFALLPAVSLFWQESILFFKMNWAVYPFILIAVTISIFIRRRAPVAFYVYLGVFSFFILYLLLLPTDWESIFRIFMTLLPLTFVCFIHQNLSHKEFKVFWILYLLAICLPVFFSFLQYIGRSPYYEFDYINDQAVGRISGGYSKPNNFVAFLFPVYMYGFYLWKIRRQRIIGLFLVFSILVIVYITGLRTAVVIFFLIFVCSFFDVKANQVTYLYFKYYLNFFVGVIAFIGAYFIFLNFGFIDAIRGRVPMWMAHTNTFFYSPWYEILFGKGRVLLGFPYGNMKIISVLGEVHNNSFRTIITFGIVGYFFYCFFIRWIVLYVFSDQMDSRLKYIKMSCFIFLLLYSITNEPAYYSSILWSTTIWLFLNPTIPSHEN